jgi:hypothetical protein
LILNGLGGKGNKAEDKAKADASAKRLRHPKKAKVEIKRRMRPQAP